MHTFEGRPAYRISRFRNNERNSKNYKGSYKLTDNHTGELVASCDVYRDVVFNPLTITDSRGNTWEMKPNRTIMPSRWILRNSEGETVVQYDQKILSKLVKPLSRTALVIRNDRGQITYRLMDLENGMLHRMLGLGATKWFVVDGNEPIATLKPISKEGETRKGIFGKLKKMLSFPDMGIISAGNTHALPAPVCLSLYLLHRELRHNWTD